MSPSDRDRVVKIPVPVGLIREIDEALVSGLGGYSTRAEFFREAAESLLLDLKYESAPAEPRAQELPPPVARASSRSARAEIPHTVPRAPGSVVEASVDLNATALHLLAPGSGFALQNGEAEVAAEPLFGMHNRDYPSLWVAHQLAKHAVDGPVSYAGFLDAVTAEAWDFAESLQSLEARLGRKLTALFPTNREKPQSASDGFRAFAIGSVQNGSGERLRSEGPLFSWRVCQVGRAEGEALTVGLTSVGWDLLRALEGISLAVPHTRDHAEAFFGHLAQYAPDDWWGFRTTLRAAATSSNRLELVDAFRAERSDWTESVASTNAQGYIARAREWGLVEPKQAAGRYVLTDFGSDYFERVVSNAGGDTGEADEHE